VFTELKQCGVRAFVLGMIVLSSASWGSSQEPRSGSMILVAHGWHPWYEVKVDPEKSSNVIICGQHWDALQNAAHGFVYASSDGAKTWRVALEDANSEWVTEQSCAFGSKHRAYFISEASKLVDGVPHHEQGTTRLFLSNDGGQSWAETLQTGWADFSTSAVSMTSGDLFTFFNYRTYESGKNPGSAVGVLQFSPDGRTVSGPFIDPTMPQLNYMGVYPSDAISLKDGSVAALYFTGKNSPAGVRTHILGLARVQVTPSLLVTSTVIASTTKNCLAIDGSSLAYDSASNSLVVAYSSEVGNACELVVARSENDGDTWTRSTVVRGPRARDAGIAHLSLVFGPNGTSEMLWEDSGSWFLAPLNGSAMQESPVMLSGKQGGPRITNDALMTVIYQPGAYHPETDGPSDALSVEVRDVRGSILRAKGLVRVVNHFQAVFPVSDGDREALFSTSDPPPDSSAISETPVGKGSVSLQDVTSQVALVYGGFQWFDRTTGILSIDFRLANRGTHPISKPIYLVARKIDSSVGKVTAQNAKNKVTGPGASWDVSEAVTGSQILPGATTYNVFRLAFHLELNPQTAPTPISNLVSVNMGVLASPELKPHEAGQ
jgi:hypothetical protein